MNLDAFFEIRCNGYLVVQDIVEVLGSLQLRISRIPLNLQKAKNVSILEWNQPDTA